MMRYIIYGLIGLACFILLAVFCINRHAAEIQSNIATQAREALKKQGFEWVTVNTYGRRVVLSGTANDEAARQSVNTIVSGVPGVSEVANHMNVLGDQNRVVKEVTPYRTEFSIKDDKIALLGAVPDQDTKNRLIAIANQRFEVDRIDDQLVEARTAPSEWSAVAESTLSELIKFNKGSVQIDETTVTIKGSMDQSTTITHGRSEMRSKLPEHYNLIYDIQVKNPTSFDEKGSKPDINTSRQKCIKNFSQIQNRFVIRFKPNQSDLINPHYQYLDELSKQLLECSVLHIEISGHADAQGSVEYNRKLSLKRAQSVADYLKQNRIDSSQLYVTGYGENKPIASNDHESGRKQNRRVEFNIQENER